MTQGLTFTYTNYRGKTAERRVSLDGIRFHYGSTEYHPEPQALMQAFDLDRQAIRDFAVRDIVFAAARSAVLQTAARSGIYVASKTKHANRWKEFRANGWPINSTWINEAGVGESGDLADLWRRCIAEASSAAVLVVYREPDDVLKGGWVEVGAALASGVPVYAVGLAGFTIAHDTRIRHFETLFAAMHAARDFAARITSCLAASPILAPVLGYHYEVRSWSTDDDGRKVWSGWRSEFDRTEPPAGEHVRNVVALGAVGPAEPEQSVQSLQQRQGGTYGKGSFGIDGFSLANATALVELFGGEETDMTVEFIPEGHSGPGFYAWCTEYPEDGSDFLGPASEFSSRAALSEAKP